MWLNRTPCHVVMTILALTIGGAKAAQVQAVREFLNDE